MKVKNYKVFIFLVMVNLACMLTSNIVAFKIIDIKGIALTGGTLVFPITYILGDIFAEVYGYKTTKSIILISFICNAFMVAIFQIAIQIPSPKYFAGQEAFAHVLGTTPRLFLAGVIAYLVGSLSNAFILEYIKYNYRIKYLWFRTILSTIVGESCDTAIFLFIGFVGVISNNDLISMFIGQTLIKILYEILCTPITYKAVDFIKEKEKEI